MNPENRAQAPANQQSAAPASHPRAASSPRSSQEDNFVEFSDHPGFNAALAITWLVAVLSVACTTYFWWLNKNITDELTDKQARRNDIVSQIESPGTKETEQKVADFKSSEMELSKAESNRLEMNVFLSSFYKKIDPDVQISSLSAGADGTLSISGKTKTYRSIALQ